MKFIKVFYYSIPYYTLIKFLFHNKIMLLIQLLNKRVDLYINRQFSVFNDQHRQYEKQTTKLIFKQ